MKVFYNLCSMLYKQPSKESSFWRELSGQWNFVLESNVGPKEKTTE
jgi:hypothetical protein